MNNQIIKKNLDITSNFLLSPVKPIKNSFQKIRDYFNTLNEDYNHFINSNDICTPLECVKEMVDTIPLNFWERKNIKIFDSCCGNGNFHSYIATKINIKNLYFNEINDKRIINLKKYFGDKINLTKRDFLTYEEKEVFDLVVSNPPYAKFNGDFRVSKNHNLSRAFIDKALKITKKGGYILFIVPNNWMSFSDRNNLPKILSKYQFIYLDINGAKKWFKKVGSSFTWFLLQKIENKKTFTVANHYKIKDKQKVKLNTNLDFIPLYLSNITLSILDKAVNNDNQKYKIETTSYLHRYTKKDILNDSKDNKHKYRLIHTPTQTVYSQVAHKWQKGYKVFISLTNQYFTFIDNCGMTQSIAFIRCKSLKEAKEIKRQLDNPIFKFIANITRYGNFNNIRVLQKLSKINSFNLNDKELYLVKNFNSKYYGTKEE